jgi:hypothetical protein
MTLSFGKASPQDMLEKAERDLARLEASESAQDATAASDAIFDLAVSVTSLRDWLKEHLPAPASKQVKPYVAASVALSSFRDIANGGKHRVIRFYTPSTNDVAASVTVVIDSALTAEHLTQRPRPESPRWRLKIIRADQSRHRAVELGHSAIQEWRTFMSLHGVAHNEA